MKNALEDRESGGLATAAFRISAPDENGNCFIVALGPDGRENAPLAAGADPFAREGA